LDIESFRGLLGGFGGSKNRSLVRAVQAVQKDRKLSAAVARSEAIEQLERLRTLLEKK
jgi:hypothetical protein